MKFILLLPFRISLSAHGPKYPQVSAVYSSLHTASHKDYFGTHSGLELKPETEFFVCIKVPETRNMVQVKQHFTLKNFSHVQELFADFQVRK